MSELKFSTLVRKVCEYMDADINDTIRVVIRPGLVVIEERDSNGIPIQREKPWVME